MRRGELAGAAVASAISRSKLSAGRAAHAQGEYPVATAPRVVDMRVSDTQWVQMKLQKLSAFGGQRGNFFARVPCSEKQQNYSSTVSYLAASLLERYRILGLAEEGSGPDAQGRKPSQW